jgi:hypothetical protein
MNEIRNKKEIIFPKLLYLDQNHWDRLEKVYYKKIEDPLVKEILGQLLIHVENGKLKIVIDINRKIETSQRKFEESRKDLTNFMLMISGENFVLPCFFLEEFEIKNYFLRKQGLPEYNIKDLAMGTDIQYLLAGRPSFSSEEFEKEDLKKLNKFLDEYVSNPLFMKSAFYKFSEKDQEARKKYIEDAEKAREILFSINSDRARKDHQDTQNFTVLMRKIFRTFQLSIEFKNKISDLKRAENALIIKQNLPLPFNTINQKRDFIRKFPLFFSHCSLVDFRDRNLDRKIEANDLIDIVSFALPIVYFDFVVGEKYFINLAKQAKLDTEYDTVLLRKISDLKEYLDKLNDNDEI